MLTALVARPGATIVAPEPSFVMYRLNAATPACATSACRCGADFALDAGAMLAAIERERPALVWLAYPNNPTGNLFDVGRDRGASCARRPAWSSSTRRTTRSPTLVPARASREFANLVVVRTRVEDRHGGAAARLRRGGSRDGSRARQGAPAVQRQRADAGGGAAAARARSRCSPSRRRRSVPSVIASPRRLARCRGVKVSPTHANFVLARFADAAR